MEMMSGSANALDVSALREELKYTRASNVNVSNFVSVKLSGCSNYSIWKAQMLCLVESQALLHIIDASHPFPRDKGVQMIEQYDKLVKGWILGSMNETVLKDFVSFKTAQDVWMKLESIFNPEISYIQGDASTQHDIFMEAFNVEVSHFVTEKLSGYGNYNIWKADMLRLIENQLLLHIINAENPFPEEKGVHMISQYDKLVKSWIFRSIEEKVVNDLVSSGSAREIWMELESSFNHQISYREETEKEHKYDELKRVNVSKFVTVKLSGRKNYKIWKAQMLCLIESQGLLHIIDTAYPFPKDKGVNMIERYDYLVKRWVVDSMERDMSKSFEYLRSARYVWMKLESFYNPIISYSDSDARAEDLKYIQTSYVNVSNFVKVKLSSRSNYETWKAQMLRLLESHVLLHIIDDEYPVPWDCMRLTLHYEYLVKGWIFGSVNKKVLNNLGYSQYSMNRADRVREIWRKLDSHFNTSESDSDSDTDTGDSVGFKFGIELLRDAPEIENTANIRRKTLYEAAVEGCWWKAKSVLKIHQNAAMEPITGEANTILHIAVEMGHNYFLEKLLEFLKDLKDLEMTNDKGRTALHIAVLVGNKYAAQLLVQKRKELLEILDGDHRSPLSGSFQNMKNINTFGYLLKAAPPSSLSAVIYEGSAVHVAVFTRQFDLARTLLEEYPNQCENALQALTLTFPADLGFTESFIYPSFNDVYQRTVKRGSLLFRNNFLDKCVGETLRVVNINNNTWYNWLGKSSMILVVPIATLYPVYQLICLLILVLRLTFSMLYFYLWKGLAATVRPIKNIENKRKEYQEAKKFLSFICEQMGNSIDGYNYSIVRAACQGTYEVIDEILFMSPATINCKDEEGHNIIQLAIIYRSEKVYNLLHHIIERTESYRTMKDSSKNNLVHLAGKLAPSFVLDRTTGAALQLQRELIWHAEVQKLLSPIECIVMNMDNESPTMVFTREHQDLLKEGEAWMKTTAESCSITAALIVTIVFAAAITVPGGNNQDSGLPVFKNETAFTIFAVFNAFSLFTAATSLLLFLSILTARFSEKDFLLSLPRRLIFGLLTLFLSTTAMIVAFGAILFLVFCDQRQWMLAPICVFACMPISVIVTLKVPLLVDFFRSTYSPIFGKQRYLESCKIKRENTIFTN